MRRPDPDAPTLFDVDALTDDGTRAADPPAEAEVPAPAEAEAGADEVAAAGSSADAGTVAAPSTPEPIAPTDVVAAPNRDAHAVDLVADAPERLRPFNDAGVLHPADVHTAVALCEMTGVDDPDLLLATALAVRGPRVGHVCVDLATVRDTVADLEDDPDRLAALPWPDDLDAWVTTVQEATALVRDAPAGVHPQTAGLDDDGGARPLTLHGTRLYLDRYWRYERELATALRDRAARLVDGVDATRLRDGLDRLFGAPATVTGPDLQRLAATTAVTRQLAVIAGGPGTGKTTTVARLLALLDEQAAATGAPAPQVALVAPTGKAAARLEESLREALDRPAFRAAVDDHVRDRLASAQASTIHRLLRRQPGNASRFRHHADEPLPHDVVVVDEASMVSLALMSKLLDALAPSTRLVLVGDPQQLRSVEAGAVLGDIVGPALQGLRVGEAAGGRLAELTGEDLSPLLAPRPAGPPTTDVPATPTDHGPGSIGDGIVVLQRVHRYGETSGIARLAGAIQAGDADAVLAVLDDATVPDVSWVRRDDVADRDDEVALATLRTELTGVFAQLDDDATAGRADEALRAVEQVRVLCAHRSGPFGVDTWIRRIERWLGVHASHHGAGVAWQVGVPVLATRNDHQLKIYNGDVGVVVATPDGPRVAFPRADGPRLLPPGRLEGLEPVHAMTIHKSQGSQFRHAVVVLPGERSRILTRELLYTGVTRAQERVTVVGSEAAVRAGVTRVVRRASGLRDRLWGPTSGGPAAAGHVRPE